MKRMLCLLLAALLTTLGAARAEAINTVDDWYVTEVYSKEIYPLDGKPEDWSDLPHEIKEDWRYYAVSFLPLSETDVLMVAQSMVSRDKGRKETVLARETEDGWFCYKNSGIHGLRILPDPDWPEPLGGMLPYGLDVGAVAMAKAVRDGYEQAEVITPDVILLHYTDKPVAVEGFFDKGVPAMLFVRCSLLEGTAAVE